LKAAQRFHGLSEVRRYRGLGHFYPDPARRQPGLLEKVQEPVSELRISQFQSGHVDSNPATCKQPTLDVVHNPPTHEVSQGARQAALFGDRHEDRWRDGPELGVCKTY
jgi:hypothetical protein